MCFVKMNRIRVKKRRRDRNNEFSIENVNKRKVKKDKAEKEVVLCE